VESSSLSSFITLAADDFEMLVSCARHPNDFSGVCSYLAPILSNFFLVCTWGFLAGVLSRSKAVDLTVLISLRMPVML
jgi:putative flippase GtrA